MLRGVQGVVHAVQLALQAGQGQVEAVSPLLLAGQVEAVSALLAGGIAAGGSRESP